MNILLKIIGGLLLLAVMLLWPAHLALQRAVAALYDPDLLETAVQRYWLDDQALIRLGQDEVHRRVQRTPHNDRVLVLWRALDALDHDQWQTLVALLFPRDVLSPAIHRGVTEWCTWLQQPQAQPRVIVPLTAWKAYLRQQAQPLTRWLLAQYPRCGMADNLRWGQAWLENDWSRAPLCVPMGANLPLAEPVVAEVARTGVERVPDEINVLDARWAPVEDVLAAQEALARLRTGNRVAPWALGVLALIALLLLARTVAGGLVAAGSAALGSGLLLWLASWLGRQVLPWLTAYLQAMVPPWAIAPTERTLAFYLQHITQPLPDQGTPWVVGGVVTLAFGLSLAWWRATHRASALSRVPGNR